MGSGRPRGDHRGRPRAPLEQANTLHLSASEFGLTATFYLVGAIVGVLFFGSLADRLGRKKLFMVTLGWYTVFTVLSAFSVNFLMFGAFRFLTGRGIGGEYSAINSAIDELIPARALARLTSPSATGWAPSCQRNQSPLLGSTPLPSGAWLVALFRAGRGHRPGYTLDPPTRFRRARAG